MKYIGIVTLDIESSLDEDEVQQWLQEHYALTAQVAAKISVVPKSVICALEVRDA